MNEGQPELLFSGCDRSRGRLLASGCIKLGVLLGHAPCERLLKHFVPTPRARLHKVFNRRERNSDSRRDVRDNVINVVALCMRERIL